MSWLDRIQRQLIITCGEGSQFTPEWLRATKQKEYNVTEFTFPNISGSLVSRKEPKGVKYGLEIYFQGENNIEEAKAFSTAADDKRPWTISHPYYDNIIVQPLNLNIDNVQHNVTKITTTVVETITDENPKTAPNPVDAIQGQKSEVDEIAATAYAVNVTPDAQDINQMQANNQQFFDAGEKIIENGEDFEAYFNAFNTANAAIINATQEPLEAIQSLQAVINQPALFQTGIRNRVNTIVTQLDNLATSIINVTQRSLKILFENNGTGLVSALANALITEAEYTSRSEVFEFIGILNDQYDSFLLNLDSIQSENANGPNDYVPDYDTQFALNQLVNLTTSQLFGIAINARQERSIVLEDDSNIVNLTHRFFGLDVLDENITEFININQIGLNEYLQIKKGRTITYFVT